MSGNRASKANVILSTECCCGVSLGLKSDTIGGHETLVSEGLCPFCWHCLVMARAGGSLLLPSPVSLSPAQIQPGAGVPGAPVCCDPSMYTASGGRSPDLPPLWWSCPAGSQGAMSPSPDLVTCQSDVQAHRASLRLAGLASPHQCGSVPEQGRECCPMEAPCKQWDGGSAPLAVAAAPCLFGIPKQT